MTKIYALVSLCLVICASSASAQEQETAIQEAQQEMVAPEENLPVTSGEIVFDNSVVNLDEVAIGEVDNDADRLFMLGLSFLKGEDGLEQDYSKAMRVFREAAAAGSAGAMTNIGVMYMEGIGVERNDERAVFWFKNAAEAGHPTSMKILGEYYLYGRGGLKHDTAVGKEWLLAAAAAGDSEAESIYARVMSRHEEAEGMKLAALNGNRMAALKCAEHFEYSFDEDKAYAALFYYMYFCDSPSAELYNSWCDLIESRRLVVGGKEFRDAKQKADAGDLAEQVNVARELASQRSEIQSLSDSKAWYNVALNNDSLTNGDFRAEIEDELAKLEKEMESVARMRINADCGDIGALVSLGEMYFLGSGVSYNYQESIACFKAAIELEGQATEQPPQPGFWANVGMIMGNYEDEAFFFFFVGIVTVLLITLLWEGGAALIERFRSGKKAGIRCL